MLAAASAELSLEAVTAVSGVCEVVQSARNALNILELCGRSDVSVAAGASQRIIRTGIADNDYSFHLQLPFLSSYSFPLLNRVGSVIILKRLRTAVLDGVEGFLFRCCSITEGKHCILNHRINVA